MSRAFVVGNGPSLNVTPLNKLIGEVSFGVNRIHLIYNQTDWRPTYYVRSEDEEDIDMSVWKDDLLAQFNSNTHVYCNHYFTKNLKKEIEEAGATERIHGIKACNHYLDHFDSEVSPHVWHMGLCSFGSSVNVCVQLAINLGYSPIYLVGCDLGYKDETPSHFSADYINVDKSKLRSAHYANMDTLAAHMVAKRSSKTPIYNATIGGQLEVYPRVNFEELF
jgi:hypothetical protein